MPVEQDVESEAEVDDVRVVAIDRWGDRRRVIRQLLEHSFKPAEIAEADSRTSAIEVVARCQPELVVLEIQMPLEEGLDTISDLRRMSPQPRIVVCSFHHDPATVVAALERGADAYVAKPIGVAELRAALGGPLPERTVRHRPPNERPVSPSPLRGMEPTIDIETEATS
jgi:DNA-binding NarL/FixJ family response regulator